MARPIARTARHRPRAGETGASAAARYIRQLIFEGRLEPGQRLPQDDIADAIGVSRIPVREAIIALEREGWLRVERHRGAFVTPFDERAVLDRFALYGRFYGFAARRALERMAPAELVELRALADRVVAAGTPAAMDRTNLAYLSEFVRLAGSNRLRAALRSTEQLVPGNFFATVPDAIDIQRAGIAEIQAALDAGDAVTAEQAFAALEHRQAVQVVTLLARTDRPS